MMAAGFDYDLRKPPMRELLASNPNATTIEVVNSFVKSPLCFEPGEKFNYSLCHDVLGAIIEAVSGKRFSEYLKENIWQKLGMERTSFGIKPNSGAVQCARYTYANDELVYDPNKNVFSLSDNYESGGAGISTCVYDYSLFADAMANGGVGASGERILKAETIDMMRTEQLSKHLKDPTFIFDDYGYGLGVRTQVTKCCGSKSPIGEFGWDGAAGSYIMMDTENRLSIFFAMNVLNWPLLIDGRKGHNNLRDLTYEILGL
jgi:CubicO group peptidase (beta-lactamase class C family)